MRRFLIVAAVLSVAVAVCAQVVDRVLPAYTLLYDSQGRVVWGSGVRPSGAELPVGTPFWDTNGLGLYYWNGTGWTAASSSGGTFTDPVLIPDGTAGAPSLAFTSDADGTGTGLFRSAANAIGVSTGGTERWIFNASGALVPLIDDTYTVGSSTISARSVSVSRAIQGSKSKALADGAATAFVRISIPQAIATNYKGGQVIYEIYCDDDTNQASQSGRVAFTCHNIAGTEACGFGTVDGVTLGDGTASLDPPTFDANSGAADTIDLRVNSNCTGVAPNTHTIEYRLDMPTIATLAPQ